MILLEGIRAVALPCTLAVLVPGLVVAVAGRLRATPTLGFAAATALLVWATGLGLTAPAGGVGQVAAALVLGGGVVAAGRDLTWVRAAGGAAAGVVSTLLWVPCVGRELGAALTAAPSDPWGQLVPLVRFGLGMVLPLLALVAVARLVDPPDTWRRGAGHVGTAVGGVLVLLLLTGAWDDAVGELVRRTVLASLARGDVGGW